MTERCVRMVFALLLGVLAEGEAFGQLLDKTGKWRYEEEGLGKTCGIEPADRSKIAGSVVIPEKLTPANGGAELLVTKIKKYAFNYCTELVTVSIPSSVTVIEVGAFTRCDKLTEINVDPQNPSFASEGGVLFNRGKTKLIRYPEGKVGAYTIPGSVKTIDDWAFIYCSKLTKVDIPDGVELIDGRAFEDCSGLTSIDLPSHLEVIGTAAFRGCRGLTKITLPKSLKLLAPYALRGCSSLMEINVEPGNAEYISIDGVLFYHAMNVLICYPGGRKGAYTIPSPFFTIEDCAFGGCSNLTEVNFPASMYQILGAPFAGRTSLKAINVDAACEDFASVDGVLFNKKKTKIIRYPMGKRGSEYAIPDGVKAIGDRAFDGCNELTRVGIPESVEEIGKGAFTDCPNLAKVTLPEGIEVLDGTFSNCPKLTGITIPASVTKIGAETFKGCQNLATITIPASVKSIADNTFGGCRALNRVYYFAAADAAVADNAFNGIANPAILIVRREDKAAIEAKAWVKNGKFTVVAEKNKVTFSTDGGLPAPDEKWVVYGENAQKPAMDPVKEGFKFEGWTCNGEDYKFDIPVIKDIELKAKYIAECTLTITSGANGSVKVTWDDAQGDALTSGVRLKEGDRLFIAATPAEGYELEALTMNGSDWANSSVFTVRTENVAVAATFKAQGGATPPSAVESVLLAAARVVQNPIDGALVLEGISTAERIEVYSLAGVQTYACAPQGEARVEIATGSWASGTYVVRIIAADGEKTVRVVKR